MNPFPRVLLVAIGVPGLCLAQSATFRPTISGSLQTGLAETFQLTLGGMFGAGPAWQNKGTLNVNNVFANADAISFLGWSTTDTPSRSFDYQVGVSYKRRLLNRRSNTLSGSLGYQRWVLNSVLKGTDDHLVVGNVTWQTKVKVPLTIVGDSWRLVSSPLRRGTILYSQAYTTHRLWSSDSLRLVARPSLASTYSWHFYDVGGLRVFRYGGSLALEGRAYSLEGGMRQQIPLLPNVPRNRYWFVMLTRAF